MSCVSRGGGFVDVGGCRCAKRNKILTLCRISSVPLTDVLTTTLLTSVYLMVNMMTLMVPYLLSGTQEVAHYAVECLFECQRCGDFILMTYDTNNKGKRARRGFFSRQLLQTDVITPTVDMNETRVNEIYARMADKSNCQSWALDMLAQVRSSCEGVPDRLDESDRVQLMREIASMN
jgi:hypothetical protein